MTEVNRLSIKIGGESGYGIIGTGNILTKLAMRSGLYAFMFHEYPNLIRGGHNTSHVRIEEEKVLGPINTCDVLIALNKETIDLHKDELTENGGIIYDNENIAVDKNQLKENISLYGIPLMKISNEISGDKILRNTIALGACAALVDFDFKLLEKLLDETYGKKGKKVTSMNVKGAKAGYDYIKKNYTKDFRNKVVKKERKDTLLLTGNEAISIGAIKAGLKFHCQYPMTPSSQILHYLIAKADEFGVVTLQLEDEISVINTALGASWCGARAMVATSGGGFCLMTEAYSLAGMTELPLVLVMGQRAGPSTGLPTKTEQGELSFVLNAGHGEFPRIVLAPGDVEECFYLTLEAFNLADKLQNPIIILPDAFLESNAKIVDRFDTSKFRVDRGLLANDLELGNLKNFKRYNLDTKTGVTLRSVPGQINGRYNCASDEHDEYGQPCEDIVNREKIMQKRMSKLQYAKELIGDKAINFYGQENADLTIIGWGSTKGRILEAMEFLEKEGIKANFLQIVCMSPFPKEIVIEKLTKAKKIVAFEENYSGQLCNLIMEKTGIEIKNLWRKYNSVPFLVSEIYEKSKFSYSNYTE